MVLAPAVRDMYWNWNDRKLRLERGWRTESWNVFLPKRPLSVEDIWPSNFEVFTENEIEGLDLSRLIFVKIARYQSTFVKSYLFLYSKRYEYRKGRTTWKNEVFLVPGIGTKKIGWCEENKYIWDSFSLILFQRIISYFYNATLHEYILHFYFNWKLIFYS